VIRPGVLAARLAEEGVSLYCGVPDSLLKEFSKHIQGMTPDARHVVAANEGNAIGLAIGHFLRTGDPALVYLQNSGIGNALNPLLSLADPEVYGIPMLLLVGWRGQPGVPDEPQHKKQGKVMAALLDSIELPWSVLPHDERDATEAVRKAVAICRSSCAPYLFLVEPGSFDLAQVDRAAAQPSLPTREQALIALAGQVGSGCVVVSSTGMLSRELFEHRRRAGDDPGLDFLVVGGMGHASSIALGIALQEQEREVWCLDGDGSLLMHLGALPVVAENAPRMFFHVVFNNGVHDSVGGQPTAIDRADVPALARACGYRHAAAVATLASLPEEVARMRDSGGPGLLELRVRPGSRSDLGRPTATPAASKASIMASLAPPVPS
jgi:phosphonopyruvate decarboxylase